MFGKFYLAFVLLALMASTQIVNVIRLDQFPDSWNLTIVAHVQDIGDMLGQEEQWVGTKGQSKRLQGFSINSQFPSDFKYPIPKITYMGHIQNVGDVDYVNEGEFIGTRGKGLRLEGFAIKLTGQLSFAFEVKYACHIQDVGDSKQLKNGEFCGTKGQSRRVQAIYVKVVKKDFREIPAFLLRRLIAGRRN